MPEPNLVPPGHGEYGGPGIQLRCPECGSVVQIRRPGRADDWVGFCPDHGLVVPVSGSQSDNEADDG